MFPVNKLICKDLNLTLYKTFVVDEVAALNTATFKSVWERDDIKANSAVTIKASAFISSLFSWLLADAAEIYKLYDVDLQPKWFPVFYMLTKGNFSVTEIAMHIGHSHPSVSKMLREMSKNGLTKELKDKDDGRKSVITLSMKGRKVAEKIKDQCHDVAEAIETISKKSQHDLWQAIEEWEHILNRKSLFQYVREQKKQRESKKVEITQFRPKYADAFRNLNEAWISAYFKMEETDHRSLDHPKKYILDKGGEIFVARYENEPVGVCTLIKMEDPEYDFELAKMAVSPKAQGKNIGWMLGHAAIEKSKSFGCEKAVP